MYVFMCACEKYENPVHVMGIERFMENDQDMNSTKKHDL